MHKEKFDEEGEYIAFYAFVTFTVVKLRVLFE